MELATDGGFHVVPIFRRLSVGAAWVTVICRISWLHCVVTVTVAVLWRGWSFIPALIPNDPLPVWRVVPIILNQLPSWILVFILIIHVVLDVTVAVAESDRAVKSHEALDKVSDGGGIAPACVTVKVRDIAPVVTVMIPVLAAVLVFAVTFTLNDPLPVWFAGDGLEVNSQVTLLLKLHVVLEFTFTVVKVPPAELGLHGV